MFGPGQRVAGDEVDARGNMGRDRVDDRLLDRSHVCQHRAGREMRRDLARDLGHRAHRHAQHDEIGAFDGLGRGVEDPVDKPDAAGGVARRLAARVARDLVRKVALADRVGH